MNDRKIVIWCQMCGKSLGVILTGKKFYPMGIYCIQCDNILSSKKEWVTPEVNRQIYTRIGDGLLIEIAREKVYPGPNELMFHVKQ